MTDNERYDLWSVMSMVEGVETKIQLMIHYGGSGDVENIGDEAVATLEDVRRIVNRLLGVTKRREL